MSRCRKYRRRLGKEITHWRDMHGCINAASAGCAGAATGTWGNTWSTRCAAVSAIAPALLYLLHPCTRPPYGGSRMTDRHPLSNNRTPARNRVHPPGISRARIHNTTIRNRDNADNPAPRTRESGHCPGPSRAAALTICPDCAAPPGTTPYARGGADGTHRCTGHREPAPSAHPIVYSTSLSCPVNLRVAPAREARIVDRRIPNGTSDRDPWRR